jgi:hypothetical protein
MTTSARAPAAYMYPCPRPRRIRWLACSADSAGQGGRARRERRRLGPAHHDAKSSKQTPAHAVCFDARGSEPRGRLDGTRPCRA